MALKETNQEFGRPHNRRIMLEAIPALAVAGVLPPRFGIQFAQEDNRELRGSMLQREEAA